MSSISVPPKLCLTNLRYFAIQSQAPYAAGERAIKVLLHGHRLLRRDGISRAETSKAHCGLLHDLFSTVNGSLGRLAAQELPSSEAEVKSQAEALGLRSCLRPTVVMLGY